MHQDLLGTCTSLNTMFFQRWTHQVTKISSTSVSDETQVSLYNGRETSNDDFYVWTLSHECQNVSTVCVFLYISTSPGYHLTGKIVVSLVLGEGYPLLPLQLLLPLLNEVVERGPFISSSGEFPLEGSINEWIGNPKLFVQLTRYLRRETLLLSSNTPIRTTV